MFNPFHFWPCSWYLTKLVCEEVRGGHWPLVSNEFPPVYTVCTGIMDYADMWKINLVVHGINEICPLTLKFTMAFSFLATCRLYIRLFTKLYCYLLISMNLALISESDHEGIHRPLHSGFLFRFFSSVLASEVQIRYFRKQTAITSNITDHR